MNAYPKEIQEQHLGEVEHVIAEAVVREHHLHALPRQYDGREGEKQRVPEPEELRLIDGQQVADRLLDGRDQVERHTVAHAISCYG